jgi:hypothetical protein
MADSERGSVVLRYRDGHALRCVLTKEFEPSDRVIEAETSDGDSVRVEVESLKAVFFLKDPQLRSLEMQLGETTQQPPPGGAPARIEFFDGEVISGRMESYSVADSGFYLFPTSVESNNERIFVVARALRTLSIEG